MLKALLLACACAAAGAFTPPSVPFSRTSRSAAVGPRGRPPVAPIAPLRSAARGARSAAAPGLRMSVKASWDNHFSAFGAQDVDRILLDYTEASEIMTYDAETGVERLYKGLAGARQFFNSLFATLKDTSGLVVPVVEVEEAPAGGLVFLVWECPTSGLPLVVDTFSFDTANKIRHQTVTSWPAAKAAPGPAPVITPPTGGKVQAGWDNHFGAFGGQDVPRIMKDYTADSVLHLYNHVTKKKEEHRGLMAIQGCFEDLFRTLSDTSTLATPVIRVLEPTPGGPGLVYLVWQCPSSGVRSVADTFIFDAAGKIIKQTVCIAK